MTANAEDTVRTTSQEHASVPRCYAYTHNTNAMTPLTSPQTTTPCEDNWRMMPPIEHQIGNRAGENIEAIAWIVTHWFSILWRQKRQLSLSLSPHGETWELLCSNIGNQYMFIITCGMWGCFNIRVWMGGWRDEMYVRCMDCVYMMLLVQYIMLCYHDCNDIVVWYLIVMISFWMTLIYFINLK